MVGRDSETGGVLGVGVSGASPGACELAVEALRAAVQEAHQFARVRIWRDGEIPNRSDDRRTRPSSRRVSRRGQRQPTVDIWTDCGAERQQSLATLRMPEELFLVAVSECHAGGEWTTPRPSTIRRADVMVNTYQRTLLSADVIDRFVRQLLGYPFGVVSAGEEAMALASVSALRSPALGLKVGAALVAESGLLLGVGRNGPKFAGTEPSARVDAGSDECRHEVIGGLVATVFRLIEDGDFANHVRDGTFGALDGIERYFTGVGVERSATSGDGYGLTDWTAVAAAMEHFLDVPGVRSGFGSGFDSLVHAEVRTLLQALEAGGSARGACLYTTHFPCVDCVRTLLEAGVKEIRYLEPYAKSAAARIFGSMLAPPDSASPDRVTLSPFEGVTPRSLHRLYGLLPRKDASSWRTPSLARWPQGSRAF